MNLDFVAEVYDALRQHIDPTERKEAADTLVNVLIDHGCEVGEIKDSFRGDREIINALAFFEESDDIDESEFDDYEDDDEEW